MGLSTIPTASNNKQITTFTPMKPVSYFFIILKCNLESLLVHSTGTVGALNWSLSLGSSRRWAFRSFEGSVSNKTNLSTWRIWSASTERNPHTELLRQPGASASPSPANQCMANVMWHGQFFVTIILLKTHFLLGLTDEWYGNYSESQQAIKKFIISFSTQNMLGYHTCVCVGYRVLLVDWHVCREMFGLTTISFCILR